MKHLRRVLVAIVAAMTFAMPAQAQSTLDPLDVPAPGPFVVGGAEGLIYKFAGVRSSGVNDTGVATSFVCTNFNTVAETVRVRLRDSGGTIVTDVPVNIVSLGTVTYSTNATLVFTEVIMGAPAISAAGSAEITATSRRVSCTAMLVDAANAGSPIGIALHGIRFLPVLNTQE
jgi:hypothetical protein